MSSVVGAGRYVGIVAAAILANLPPTWQALPQLDAVDSDPSSGEVPVYDVVWMDGTLFFRLLVEASVGVAPR